MEKKLITEAERFLSSRHQNKRRTQLMRGVALLVVVATISALIMPAVTMSNEVECGLEEHIHTESCYATQQVAPQPVLTCAAGASDAVVIHTHDDSCRDSLGNLICDLPEVQTDAQALACRKQEVQAHTHGAACYDEDGALTCEMEEAAAHQHTDACFTAPEGGPEEAKVLTCDQEEHTHTDQCYVKTKPEAEKFYCGLEEHSHSKECYFSSGELRARRRRHSGRT